MTIAELDPTVVRAFAIALGLVLGSFLNVVVHRVPRGESLVRPGSRCPACGRPIGVLDNVPVLSWIVLRGRARCCGARIAPRYVAVEAIGGLYAWALVEMVVLPMPAAASIGRAGIVFATDLAFGLALVAAAFIDLEHMYVPDAITIGAAVLGVATFALRPPLGVAGAALGAAIGFALVYVPFTVLYRLVRGRTGMGVGDAKLAMAAGAWLGWKGAVFSLLAGAVQGTLVAVPVLLVRGKIDEPAAVRAEREEVQKGLESLDPAERAEAERELRRDPLFETGADPGPARVPFGPFLALAAIEYLLFGDVLVEPWLAWMAP